MDYLSSLALSDNCIQLQCQPLGGFLRLGKKGKNIVHTVHFCGFSQHSFIHSFIHYYNIFFLSTWGEEGGREGGRSRGRTCLIKQK